jgi:hypothetical protein
VQGVSARNFGLLIAYVLPGFVTLWGVGLVSPAVHLWLVGSTAGGPDVSGFLYTSIASIAVGMTVSAVRWATVDSLHAATGLVRPAWDDSRLSEQLRGFEALVENHYRYYQFYANMLVALALAYGNENRTRHRMPFQDGYHGESRPPTGTSPVSIAIIGGRPGEGETGRGCRPTAWLAAGTNDARVPADRPGRLRVTTWTTPNATKPPRGFDAPREYERCQPEPALRLAPGYGASWSPGSSIVMAAIISAAVCWM